MQVKKNEIHIVQIDGMTHEGQGVGRIDGFAVFVEGAIQGETVEIKIIKVAKNYCVGKLLRIIKPSADRVEPFCGVYKRCGGCNLQHLDYKAQLKFKENLVREAIKRIGKIDDVKVNETIGMQNPVKYRNKAQYPVGRKNGITPIMGFYARRSHDIVESEFCAVQNEASDMARNVVNSFIRDKGVSVYDEATGNGIVRHVMTRVGFKSGEVMVVIVINGEDLPEKEELVKRLINGVKGVKSVVLNINRKATNVILGDRFITIYGKDYITDYIGEFAFRISLASFFQVNPVQTEVLYNKVLEYASLTGDEIVFDLYCGIGTISLFLAKRAKMVYGVEIVEEAVADARKNAELNGITNVEFMAGGAEAVVQMLYSRGVKADVAVVDPPRKGCEEGLLQALVSVKPRRIVYVSCNPATLARDLRYLNDNGYKAVEVQPVDMFPHTGHVECVVLITKL